MNALLLIVGIVFLLSVIIGYKRGLVKIIASLLATLVCIVLVFLISPSVSKWIQESTPLKETVKNKCIELLLPDETTDTGGRLTLQGRNFLQGQDTDAGKLLLRQYRKAAG